MEQLRTSATIHDPDPRRLIQIIINRRTGVERRFSLADIELRVGDIPVPTGAPEEVQDLLVTAKNLLLYSWHYFPFSDTASLQAAIAVERALKIRLGATERESFNKLLRQAVESKLVTHAGFVRWDKYRNAFRRLHDIPQPAESRENLTEVLLRTLTPLRNAMAHGDPFMADSGFLQVDIAVEIIEQLFPQK